MLIQLRRIIFKAQKLSYNEEEARVFSANRVRYHADTYILTCER